MELVGLRLLEEDQTLFERYNVQRRAKGYVEDYIQVEISPDRCGDVVEGGKPAVLFFLVSMGLRQTFNHPIYRTPDLADFVARPDHGSWTKDSLSDSVDGLLQFKEWPGEQKHQDVGEDDRGPGGQGGHQENPPPTGLHGYLDTGRIEDPREPVRQACSAPIVEAQPQNENGQDHDPGNLDAYRDSQGQLPEPGSPPGKAVDETASF